MWGRTMFSSHRFDMSTTRLPGTISVVLSRQAYNQFYQDTVTVSGRLLVRFQSYGKPSELPIGGSADIPGVGQCVSSVSPDRDDLRFLSVECESADGNIPSGVVTLEAPSLHGQWKQPISNPNPIPQFQIPWITPIERGKTFFHVVEFQPQGRGTEWLVPLDVLAPPVGTTDLRLTVTPVHVTGYKIVDYRFSGIHF